MNRAEDNKLTRTKVKAICIENDVAIGKNFSLSNRTQEGITFSNTIPIEYLSQDFWLLLNDQDLNELHVLKIPANSIPIDDMYNRNDKPSIFMKIYCDDETFEDSISGITFRPWFVKTIKTVK
ncbi:MAG: hypothetical protein FWC72_07705 [Oscillospiraceae bacterium]|nr:hypothetical protein [Oscillospiraceae bacterium]